MTIDQKVYSPGDFVYYDVPESKCKLIWYLAQAFGLAKCANFECFTNSFFFFAYFSAGHNIYRTSLDQQ